MIPWMAPLFHRFAHPQPANLAPKDKLLALKLIMECNEAKFALFKEGPAIMQVTSLEERLEKIESREINR
jgi:hypothetical protein